MSEMQSAQPPKPSLYERLGGYDAIYTFAGEILRTCMRHPDIGQIWAHASESSFQKEHINFVDFLSQHWGGNAVYRGRDMVTAHRGMGLTEVHWKAVFECIDECYERYAVPDDIREEVTAFLTRFKPAVIGSPSYRDVVLAHPEMDVGKGMKSVGIHWPSSGSVPKHAEQTKTED